MIYLLSNIYRFSDWLNLWKCESLLKSSDFAHKKILIKKVKRQRIWWKCLLVWTFYLSSGCVRNEVIKHLQSLQRGKNHDLWPSTCTRHHDYMPDLQTETSTELNILILHHLACLKLKRIFQVRNDLQTTHNALQHITNTVNAYRKTSHDLQTSTKRSQIHLALTFDLPSFALTLKWPAVCVCVCHCLRNLEHLISFTRQKSFLY